MATPLVSRAYDIQITGYKEAKENLETLTSLISSLDAAKRSLNAELKTKITLGDPASIENLQKQIKALEDQIKNLDKTREKSAKELETLAKAEKLEADAKLASAKASTELIKGDALRSASIIAQERELDRLIAIEEKEEQARLKANAAANAAIKPVNTTGTNTTNNTNNTTAGLNVNANTGAANDSLTALRATLKALESEFNNLSLSSSDYSEKSKVLSDSIRSTKIEIAQLTESTKVSRAETISLASSLEIEAGSYKDVLAQLRELRPFVQTKLLDSTATIDFRGQTLGIVEATAKFKELSVVEQDFRRQFAKDGLLVAEYSSGIIKAFKELGVTDIFKKQKDDINNELNSIKSQNQTLAEEYKRLATESTHALDQISTSLKQNTVEQTNLSKSIHTSSGQQKTDFENQLAELQKINAELKAQFDTLKRSGGEAFDKLSNDLKENIALQEKMRQSLGHIDDALGKSGTIGSTFSKSISEGFKDATGQLKQLVLGYIGFQAVFSGVVSGIGITKELSDQTTNLEVELGKAKGGVRGIVDELSKLDTRTKLTELTNIANIAAKAGVDEKNLVGVTKAIDEIKIAFGKDFGDVEQGTESLVKLVNVFEGTKNVNEQSLLRVGNAVRTLANESVASVPFLNDFSKRMAGLKGISDISLPSVLGLASGFEQFGQSSEVAGTALTKVIPKLANDTEKYGKIAGLTQKAFSDLIKNNPAEALIKVTEGLVKGKSGVEDISKAFADSELPSGRIAAILSTIGLKADDFRKAISSAGKAYGDTSNIIEAFNAKNTNTAATLDKIGASFVKVFNSPQVVNAIDIISKAVLGFITLVTAIPFSVVVAGLGLMTAAWALYKGNAIAATLAQSANNEATLLGSIRLGFMRTGLAGAAAQQEAYAIRAAATAQATNLNVVALETEIAAQRSAIAALEAKIVADASQTVVLDAEIAARRAHVVALEAEVAATEGATVATEGLNVATKASPIGIILTLIALLIPAFSAYAGSLSQAEKNIKGVSDATKIEGEIQASMLEQTGKTKNAVKELVDIIKTEVHNQGLRKAAYDELIKISPDFVGTLDKEYNATAKLNDVYDKYIIQLDKVSRAQALKNVKQKFNDQEAEAQGRELIAKLAADNEAAQNKNIEAQNKATLIEGISSTSLGGAGTAFAKVTKLQTEKKQEYEKAKAEAKKAADAKKGFDEFVSRLNDEDKKALLASDKPVENAPAKLQKQSLEELQKDLTTINEKISQAIKSETSQTERLGTLKILRARRTQILKDIADLTPDTDNTKAFTGSRTTGDEKDDLKRADTIKAQQLTSENLFFAKIQENRKATRDEEVAHLKALQSINDTADNAKIAAIKGHNAEEEKERKDFELSIVLRKIDTNTKIETLNKEQFAKESLLLKKQLEEQKARASLAFETIDHDPNISNTDKAIAKKAANDKLMQLDVTYYDDLDRIAKQYKQSGEEIEAEKQKALANIIKAGLDNDRGIVEARLKDIDRVYQDSINEIEAKFAGYKIKVLDDPKKSSATKQSEINQIDIDKEKELANNAAAHAGLIFEQIKKDYEVGAATLAQLKKALADYQDAVVNYKNKTSSSLKDAFRGITDVQGALRAGLTVALKFDKKDSDTVAQKEIKDAQQKVLGETIAAGFDLATNAMHNYFDAEKQRSEESKRLAYERIDLETKQLLAKSQSQAERDSIEKQAAAKKKDADKKAFEENKKMQIAQAEINLAIQLSNLAVVTSAPGPANFLTIGVAGRIAYIIQAALAVASFALNVAAINKAKAFAKGGLVSNIKNYLTNSNSYSNNSRTNNIKNYRKDEEDIPTIGIGRITMTPNIERQPNGDNVLAYVPVGHVVLNEKQQSDVKRIAKVSNISSSKSSATNKGYILATLKVGEEVIDEDVQKKLGGARTFKLAGVPGFADGGIAQTLGGTMIGSTLIAPSNPSLFLNSNSSSNNEVEKLSKMIAVVADNVNSVNNRITNLKVINVVTETDRVLQDNKKANNIGTL